MFDKSPKYHIRILRFWAERHPRSQKIITRRFSLENPETEERRSVTNLEDLLTYLQTDIQKVFSETEGLSQDQEGESP